MVFPDQTISQLHPDCVRTSIRSHTTCRTDSSWNIERQASARVNLRRRGLRDLMVLQLCPRYDNTRICAAVVGEHKVLVECWPRHTIPSWAAVRFYLSKGKLLRQTAALREG